MANAGRFEAAMREWLTKRIAQLSADILDGRVTVENYREKRAERAAFLEALGALPDISRKVYE
jgi:uncharacterized protein YydD (DUF2326 family)